MLNDDMSEEEFRVGELKNFEDEEEKVRITLDDDIPNSNPRDFGNLEDKDYVDDQFGNILKPSSSIDWTSFTHLDSEKIMVEKIFVEKSGNTPRKIIEMFLDHFSEFKSWYQKPAARQITQFCNKLKAYHEEDRRNVYKFEQLTQLFVSIYALGPENEKITRRILYTILRKYGISSLKKPRSQVQNKVHYLRVMKIFSIRCRSQKLRERNQTR